MSLFQRLRDALGLNEEYDEYYCPDDEDTTPDPYLDEVDTPRRKTLPSNAVGHASSPSNHPSSNIIGLPGLTMEVILMQPRSFEEIPDAVTALRERKAVILNLNYIEIDQAQRCADYVAGGAFAIDGRQQQIDDNVFLFTPNFVQITNYSPQPEPPPPQFYAPTTSVWEPEPMIQKEF